MGTGLLSGLVYLHGTPHIMGLKFYMKGPFGSFPFMVVKIVKERYSTTLCKFIIWLKEVTAKGVREGSVMIHVIKGLDLQILR